MCSAQSNLVNYVTADLVKILEEKRYSEVFDRLCRIREKGDCFPDLEEAFAKGTEDNMRVSELSTHEGYTSAIYKYRNVFAVKFIAVSSENMLKYALSEVNTGIKVNSILQVQGSSFCYERYAARQHYGINGLGSQCMH